MARKAKKTSEKETAPKTQPAAVKTEEKTPAVPVAPEAPETPEKQEAPKNEKFIIVYKPSGDGFYVYFQGVKPENNVGCRCKTPQSTLRYMYLLKKRHNAVIDRKCYASLSAMVEKKGK